MLSNAFGVTPSRRPRSNRRGLTLYEVLLAIAIFLGSIVVIGQIIAVGTRASVQAELRTKAAMLCEAKMNELVAGVEPLTAGGSQAFADQPGWSWSLELGSAPYADLMDLKVTVVHTDQLGDPDASFSIHRYLRDPQIFADAAAAEAETVEEAP